MPYLDSILASRLQGVFADAEVSLQLIPGELTRSGTGSEYDPGQIIIAGIQEPWPEGTALRQALDQAFEEAGSVEVEQMARMRALVAHLRST